MQPIVYAPIILPTLNRLNKLQKCIASLQKNGWADKTEIFISIDFPPSTKFIDGNNKILQYLKKGINGFKAVHIYEQKKNLGIYGNLSFLRSEAYKSYDRYIYLEDDNVVSGNFIEYMDKCLQLFEESEDIISICGFIKPNMNTGEYKIFKMINFTAYGYATWKKKEIVYNTKINYNYLLNILNVKEKLRKLYNNNLSLFLAYISAVTKKEKVYYDINNNLVCIDMVIRMYMVIENKFSVFPGLSLVCNSGYDGSGTNCKNSNNRNMVFHISDDSTFNLEIKDISSLKIVPERRKKRTFMLQLRCIHGSIKLKILRKKVNKRFG